MIPPAMATSHDTPAKAPKGNTSKTNPTLKVRNFAISHSKIRIAKKSSAPLTCLNRGSKGRKRTKMSKLLVQVITIQRSEKE